MGRCPVSAQASRQTEIYYNGRTQAEHCGWVDSLIGDDYRVLLMPIGHLFDLAEVSFLKYVLVKTETAARERMKMLDMIAGCVFGSVSAEAIAAVDPMCVKGVQIFSEILDLPVEKQTKAFSAGDVFRLLARLNPNLLTALRLCRLGSIPDEPRTTLLEDAQ
jgi:hypothetical protein